MSNEIIQVKVTTPLKLILVLTILLSLVASWFVVQWYLGNTIAANVMPSTEQLATAEMAVRMAPKDPLSHWRLGKLIQTEFHSDQINRVVAEYEQAVSLAPNDYRFWMDLGGALEQAGEIDKAEKALRTAVKLAPAYAFPRWYLGNLLIRDGRYSEAFAELQRASDANEKFQPQLFNLAWQINKTDFEALKAAIGDTPGTRAEFSKYLVGRGKLDEGLQLWNSLTESEKKPNRAAADSIISSLIAGKHFHNAMAIWNDVTPAAHHRAQLGQFVDPGFEYEFVNVPGAVFGWQVPSTSQLQIAVDPTVSHTGSRSLKFVFQVRNQLDEIKVSQLVPVEANTQYDFEWYLKTNKLVSAATPVLVVTDADDDAVLATSQPAPIGENDWQRGFLTFKTGAKAEALRLKMNRASCDADSPVCPIYGNVWYDDFNLKARK
ncbi:MAG TPA: tetratricopeptide repeat protein [Pyrinomonadaceae bacterium]|nr:tetratricopeptide repeat protein [Pyrinomonadaceae bacterium]